MGRYAPLAGILAAVMVVAAALIGGETPSADDSASSIISFWRDNDTKELWSAVLLGWAAIPLVFFAGCLRSALRAGESSSGGWSSVAFGGLVIFAVGILINAGVQISLADVADSDKTGAGTILSLNALNNTMWMPLIGGIGIALLGFAIGAMRLKLFPTWLRWLALVNGLICISPVGFIGLMLSVIWFVAASIVMYRASGDKQSTDPAPPPAPAATG
jgi:hypothetical protein